MNFQHAPLDLESPSIRVLEVLPGRDEHNRIKCRLRHTTTADKYTCLSYEWGDYSKTRQISVDGELFEVKENLWRFLRLASSRNVRCSNLPFASRARTAAHGENLDFDSAVQSIWVDALCIDQSNVSERNHQVQHMGSIYQDAHQVMIWLGSGDLDALPLFSYLKKNYDKERTTEDELISDSIRWLNKQSYWTRAWVTQEVVLAKQAFILSGKVALNLAEVHDTLCNPYQVSRGLCHKSWQTLVAMRSSILSKKLQAFMPTGYRKPFPYEGTLLQNLALFGDKTCHLSLDKVFSLLSISTDGHKIEVDYKMGIADLAKQLMLACGSQFCLCQVYTISVALQLGSVVAYGSFVSFRAIEVFANCCHSCKMGFRLPLYIAPSTRRWICCLHCEHADGNGRAWWNNFGHIVVLRFDHGVNVIYWIKTSGEANDDLFSFLTPKNGLKARDCLHYEFMDAPIAVDGQICASSKVSAVVSIRLSELMVLAGVVVRDEAVSKDFRVAYPPKIDLDDKAHGLLRTDTLDPTIHGWIFDEKDNAHLPRNQIKWPQPLNRGMWAAGSPFVEERLSKEYERAMTRKRRRDVVGLMDMLGISEGEWM